MTRGLDVVKNSLQQVARDVLVALQDGQSELLADEVSQSFKAALSGPVEGLAFSIGNGARLEATRS
jgi:hypothetical protein